MSSIITKYRKFRKMCNKSLEICRKLQKICNKDLDDVAGFQLSPKIRRGIFSELIIVIKMKYLRPLRGVFSERTMQIANEEGYRHVFWSLAFVDWNVNQQKGWQYSYDNIMKQAHLSSILQLNTVSKDNADALDKVIHDLKNKDYKFKSLDKFRKK
jgi:peptidoglycan/xylan/chitin deacetylase (PgdA/CDA1 family)